MRQLATGVLLTLFASQLAAAQAPPTADMWRVAAATLAQPPALNGGPTSRLWNPAPRLTPARGLSVAMEVLQTPDVIGLSGILAGVSQGVGSRLTLGAMIGRIEVQDLVRTTTSPLSVEGDIPVYTQLATVSAGVGGAAWSVGADVSGHDTRFDQDHSTGLTADLGVRLSPLANLTLAGATHFVPVNLATAANTDFYAGAQYVVHAPLWGTGTSIAFRYGLTYHRTTTVDHFLGLGITLGERFTVDGAWVRESAYGTQEWRPGLGLGFRVGHYTIAIGRGGGLNGLGPTYRIGLDIAQR